MRVGLVIVCSLMLVSCSSDGPPELQAADLDAAFDTVADVATTASPTTTAEPTASTMARETRLSVKKCVDAAGAGGIAVYSLQTGDFSYLDEITEQCDDALDQLVVDGLYGEADSLWNLISLRSIATSLLKLDILQGTATVDSCTEFDNDAPHFEAAADRYVKDLQG